MRFLKTNFALLLIAMITLGCGKQPPDPAQLRADETTLIQSTVTDPARAQKLLALLDQRDRLIEETGEMLQQYRREMKNETATLSYFPAD